MEPNMFSIDDYSGNESSKKRALVYGILAGILTLSVVFTSVKHYYDSHTPEVFNQVVVK